MGEGNYAEDYSWWDLKNKLEVSGNGGLSNSDLGQCEKHLFEDKES